METIIENIVTQAVREMQFYKEAPVSGLWIAKKIARWLYEITKDFPLPQDGDVVPLLFDTLKESVGLCQALTNRASIVPDVMGDAYESYLDTIHPRIEQSEVDFATLNFSFCKILGGISRYMGRADFPFETRIKTNA